MVDSSKLVVRIEYAAAGEGRNCPPITALCLRECDAVGVSRSLFTGSSILGDADIDCPDMVDKPWFDLDAAAFVSKQHLQLHLALT